MANIFNQSIYMAYDRRVDQITAECKGLNIELLDVKSIPLREVRFVKTPCPVRNKKKKKFLRWYVRIIHGLHPSYKIKKNSCL